MTDPDPSLPRPRSLLAFGSNRRRGKPLNLGLQGGGAHGAFTWGVLDALLEREDIAFDAVSGASAGALNAVALAAGLLEDGRAGARVKLAALWEAIAGAIPAALLPPAGLPSDAWLGIATRMMSPYQFNPFDVDPLRHVLTRTIDFEALRRHSPLQLYIAATDVADGKARLFGTAELSREVLLASTCLPHLRQAVRIGDRHYWDGGYSANPPVLPLVFERGAADTLIVLVDPTEQAQVPTSASEIARRLGALAFNAPLRREIELIEHWRSLASEGVSLGSRRQRRLRRHRFHLIEAGAATGDLAPASKLYPVWPLLEKLRDLGRTAAQGWIELHAAALGSRSTVDLAARFL
jgi:NTE family protein